MRKLFIFTILCVFLTTILRGQSSTTAPTVSSKTPPTTGKKSTNLVVNFSFEQHADSTKTFQLMDKIPSANGWTSPTKGKPSLHSSEAEGNVYDGYGGNWKFKARTGKNVAGLNVYGGTEEEPKRDYIQGSLSEPLTVGKKYFFAFYVHYHCEGANNIGIAFLPQKLTIDSAMRLPLSPATYQRRVTRYNKDTSWSLVIDSFVAQRPYQYFIIGNFFKNSETRLQSDNFNHHFAYIDDVFVIQAKNEVMPEPVKPPPPPKPTGTKPTAATPEKPVAEDSIWIKNDKYIAESSLPKVAQRIQFKFNSTEFEPATLPELDTVFDILTKTPSVKCRIKGHTSSDGNADHNQKLSERRAEAVLDYLVKKGIDPTRLRSQGFGSTVLLQAEDSEEARKLNRRVEFDIEK
jgi:outer membrane protein OmpA-like peptidoglycan-associated protein